MYLIIKEFMNKLKNKDMDVFLLILVLMCGASFVVFVNFYDELWNFANCYKMFNGYKIYEELNIIITPLFFYVAQIFFLIFGANLLAFRIYNVFILTIFFMLIYLIFKSLNIVKKRAVFYTIVIIFIFQSMISCGANYNIFALIPILIAILSIIKGKENPIILGILLFLTFMLKQNIFVYFALGIFIYKIINKQNIKKMVIDLIKIYMLSLIWIVIFLIYMYIDNNLYNFINYCFGGIGEFGIKNLHININDSRIIYISIIAIITTLYIIYNQKIREKVDETTINNSKYLLCFGIPMLLTSFPLVNYYHATLGSVLILIELIYIIENILIKNFEIKKEKVIYKILIIIYIIYVFYGIVVNRIEIKKGEVILNSEGPFWGTIIQKEEHEDIKIICNYIKEQKKKYVDVKILSYKANLYMVNLNENNEIFDLAFVGNLGHKGEKALIYEIQKLKDTLILIQSDEEKIFWQESKIAREYIINNYEKIGEIQEYSIYYIGR